MGSTWTVQRKQRANGWYYEGITRNADGSRRCISLRYLPDAPESAALADTLRRAIANAADFTDDEIRDIASIPEDASLRATMILRFNRKAATIEPAPLKQMTPAMIAAMGKPEPTGRGALTLQAFHDAIWWPIRSDEVAESTVRVEQKLWPVILEALGDIKIGHLDAVIWREFLQSRKTWGGTMRRLAQNAYRCALKHAVEIKAIEDVHTFRPIKGSSKRQVEPVALKANQIAAGLDAAATPAHRSLYAMMLGQGLGPTEATLLTWDCFDFPAGVLYPKGKKNKHRSKAVPMTPLVLSIREYWLSLGCPTSGPAFLWRKKPILDPREGFNLALARAGVEHIRLYDCRHTFATELARNKVPISEARRLMRHSTVSTILERAYQHLDAEDLLPTVANLPSYRTA